VGSSPQHAREREKKMPSLHEANEVDMPLLQWLVYVPRALFYAISQDKWEQYLTITT
jgi:hypothetical protein